MLLLIYTKRIKQSWTFQPRTSTLLSPTRLLPRRLSMNYFPNNQHWLVWKCTLEDLLRASTQPKIFHLWITSWSCVARRMKGSSLFIIKKLIEYGVVTGIGEATGSTPRWEWRLPTVGRPAAQNPRWDIYKEGFIIWLQKHLNFVWCGRVDTAIKR